MIWLGALLSSVVLLGFNYIMSRRGCEKVYFTKNCLPKGQSVKSYYSISFAFELVFTVALYAGVLLLRINNSGEYIPGNAIGINVAIVPLAIIVAEIICLILNHSLVTEMTRKVELELQKEKEQTPKEDNKEDVQDV